MLERKHHYGTEKTLVVSGKVYRATPTTDLPPGGAPLTNCTIRARGSLGDRRVTMTASLCSWLSPQPS